jgi:hypothetical protein
MAWSLAIHHIDVIGIGDATLFIAREDDGGGNIINFRSCLVDAGLQSNAPQVAQYISDQLTPLGRTLDIIVCTHYDRDHMWGITYLMEQDTPLCRNVRIYDQGWPGEGEAENIQYLRYILAIDGYKTASKGPVPLFNPRPNRTRVSISIMSDIQEDTLAGDDENAVYAPVPPKISSGLRVGIGLPALTPAETAIPETPPLDDPEYELHLYQNEREADEENRTTGIGKINQLPSTLLGTDILWDGIGQPNGAPSMTCIAVNRYIEGAGSDNPVFKSALRSRGETAKNEKSLAFLIEFNNFKYYIGGDIEEAQENYLQNYLNSSDTVEDRVLAFKPSHHGSNTATSRSFVSRIRPEAAFISCGTENQFDPPLPSIQTVNVLEGFPRVPDYEDTAAPPVRDGIHGDTPPPPPCRPVKYYLTGYQVKGSNTTAPPSPSISKGGSASMTAGDPLPAPPIRGDIVLLITEAQSQSNVAGQEAIAVSSAAERAALTLGATPDVANQAASFAQEAFIVSGAQVTAAAIAALLGVTVGIEDDPDDQAALKDALKDTLNEIGELANDSATVVDYLNGIAATVTTTLNNYDTVITPDMAAAAGQAALVAATQAEAPGITAQVLAGQVTTNIMGGPVRLPSFEAAAASAGAAAGAALNGKNAVAAGAATFGAILAAGGNNADAQYSGDQVEQIVLNAAAPGLFNVQFYDKNTVPPGVRAIQFS